MTAAGPPHGAPRGEPGSLRALALALAVHGAFFALIVFGVSWQSRAPQPVQAEVWDRIPIPKPELARDLTRPIERPPDPEKPIDLKAPPAIDKRPEEAKPAPPRPDPEIAEKAARDKREKERLEKLERQKAAEAKKRQEEEARRKAEAEKKRREEEAARQQREAAEAAQRAEFAQWVDRIRAKIRGRANVPDTVRGSPEVHVLIRVLPGGEVLDIQVTQRSGNPAYDNAIERGIRSASPLPVPPPNSELFPRFRELNLVIRHER